MADEATCLMDLHFWPGTPDDDATCVCGRMKWRDRTRGHSQVHGSEPPPHDWLHVTGTPLPQGVVSLFAELDRLRGKT